MQHEIRRATALSLPGPGSCVEQGTPGEKDMSGPGLQAPPGTGAGQPERLQKVLAKAGLGSRRTCEEMIADGRVTVNGVVAQLGQRADGAHDAVAVDGIPLPGREGLAYYLVNKPLGVICTASDPQGRPTVTALVPAEPRVFPVGRLDVASEGLIVLTNDGELAYKLTHPSFGVLKEYVVEVEGTLSRHEVGRLRRGVPLDDGMTAPAKVSLLGPGSARVSIHEGRNRQVRRMCDAVGHPVRRLVRTRIGPVSAPELASGEWRHLSAGEIRLLWDAASSPAPARKASGPSGAVPGAARGASGAAPTRSARSRG